MLVFRTWIDNCSPNKAITNLRRNPNWSLERILSETDKGIMKMTGTVYTGPLGGALNCRLLQSTFITYPTSNSYLPFVDCLCSETMADSVRSFALLILCFSCYEIIRFHLLSAGWGRPRWGWIGVCIVGLKFISCFCSRVELCRPSRLEVIEWWGVEVVVNERLTSCPLQSSRGNLQRPWMPDRGIFHRPKV